jgi:hypothetical protein
MHWRQYTTRIIAAEISTFSRYYDQVIQWKLLPHDSGLLFRYVDCSNKKQLSSYDEFPDLSHEYKNRSLVLLNGTLNHHFDIQGLLRARAKIK